MISDILAFAFNFIINGIMLVTKLLLAPIDALIATLLPDISEGIGATTEFLELVAQGLGWALSATGLADYAIAMAMTALIFRITFPLQIWVLKLSLKWYKQLKG